MNDQIRQLLEQSGFVLWGDEEWNPGSVVDWASDYDEEIVQLIETVARECIDIVKPTEHHRAYPDNYVGGVDGLELLEDRVKKIKQRFNVE